jgi:hypothetical protein
MGTVPFGSGETFRISKPKLEPNGTVPGSLFEPKRGLGETVPSAQFRPKTVFEAKPERKPWQKGNFQVVTESMLKNSAPSSDSVLHEGNVIEHERFGIGSVLSVEGSGDNTKARIKFLNVGEKTLLLKFARYKILK